jgi:Histidine kinase-, DNA gyrase B-, and HSP90-like ATPase
MTRWSLRRRSERTQEPGRERQPAVAAPVLDLPPAASPLAGQPASGPQAGGWFEPGRGSPGQPEAAQPGSAWPDICDQFGLQLLVLTEQLRASLDELEADEDDPERLRRLYQVDHAVTRMRRASRDLRTLAGRSEEELAGFTTSLLDIIRMAASAIERYTQVTIGRVTDLAVLGYAADDVGSVMAALLDNATRYSPGTVTVSGHLLEDGGVMFRIEDTGIGIGADQVAVLNAAFAGPVPDVDERTGRHTGFPVAHRIARKHSIGVRLAARPLPSSGTVAMVTLPPNLLCEVPADEPQRRPAPAIPAQSQSQQAQSQQAQSRLPQRPSAVPDLPRGGPARADTPQWEQPEPPDGDQPRAAGGLPRRERASLRGGEPRPRAQEPGMVPTAEQQAAARRAFAEELSAFSLGSAGLPVAAGNSAGSTVSGAVSNAADTATEADDTASEEEGRS